MPKKHHDGEDSLESLNRDSAVVLTCVQSIALLYKETGEQDLASIILVQRMSVGSPRLPTSFVSSVTECGSQRLEMRISLFLLCELADVAK